LQRVRNKPLTDGIHPTPLFEGESAVANGRNATQAKTNSGVAGWRNLFATPLVTALTSTLLAGNHAVDKQKNNRAKYRRDKTRRLADLVETHCPSDKGRNDGPDNADDRSDDEATRVAAGHQKLGNDAHDQTNNNCPQNAHIHLHSKLKKAASLLGNAAPQGLSGGWTASNPRIPTISSLIYRVFGCNHTGGFESPFLAAGDLLFTVFIAMYFL
jgi:hypothetical protein